MKGMVNDDLGYTDLMQQSREERKKHQECFVILPEIIIYRKS